MNGHFSRSWKKVEIAFNICMDWLGTIEQSIGLSGFWSKWNLRSYQKKARPKTLENFYVSYFAELNRDRTAAHGLIYMMMHPLFEVDIPLRMVNWMSIEVITPNTTRILAVVIRVSQFPIVSNWRTHGDRTHKNGEKKSPSVCPFIVAVYIKHSTTFLWAASGMNVCSAVHHVNASRE